MAPCREAPEPTRSGICGQASSQLPILKSAALQGKKDKDKQQPLLSVDAEKNEWTLRPDLLSVIDRTVSDTIPAFKDEGKPLEGLAVRNAQVTLSPLLCPALALSLCSAQRANQAS